ncbi:hypothetical protein GRX01_09330 [Halobaculum sp. WSA2]|uniref:Halobacterial output domain-containing protein n=1 Tax=Halobaculum saliterrae TaxID=2073113 RepID=A0A6B0SRH3_9EURY|nr:HalOD1 output domain-containing protein [Halobaculum saliterrae]MXR41538.1 hypothetical protein [Halobaculum saliterrae]
MSDQSTRRDDASEGGRPSLLVIDSVAEATDTDPLRLPPLHDVVDPDALDRLFPRDLGLDTPAMDSHVTFRYHGCDVTVHANGGTTVDSAGEDT